MRDGRAVIDHTKCQSQKAEHICKNVVLPGLCAPTARTARTAKCYIHPFLSSP